MVELDCVANADIIGGGINDCVSTVSNAESVPCVEVSYLAWARFVVDGDFESNWAERCGVVVNRNFLIFPR